MIFLFVYNTLKLSSSLLEMIWCTYFDATNRKNTFTNNVALIEGDPSNNLIKNIVVELIKRDIHVVLIVSDNDRFNNIKINQIFDKDIILYNSLSTIHIINKTNLYTLDDSLKNIDLNKRNFNIDILILNHIESLSKLNEKYTSSSIITRQILPGMINQEYGRIIYIEPSLSDLKSTVKVKYDMDLSLTGLQKISDASNKELANNNIKIFCVKGSSDSNYDTIMTAYGLGKCLDYDILAYSTESIIDVWWRSLLYFIESF